MMNGIAIIKAAVTAYGIHKTGGERLTQHVVLCNITRTFPGIL